jgi:hypothetical protein
VPIRFVQIGAVSGPNIALPSAVLRSSAIELMGSGIGSIPFDRFVHAIDELLRDRAGRLRDRDPSGSAVGCRTSLVAR